MLPRIAGLNIVHFDSNNKLHTCTNNEISVIYTRLNVEKRSLYPQDDFAYNLVELFK